MAAPFALIFFVSGAAALVFETLWFHQIGLLLGNSVWSTALVLTGFMAGLGLGNGLAARLGGRAERPARVYAVLELVSGATGLLVVLAAPRLTGLLVPMLRAGLGSPALLAAVRLGTALALLLVPTTAMGATLPLLVKACGSGRYGETLGILYGANTAGAVAGAVLSEVFLLERFGVRGAAVAAASLNLVAALGALALARAARPSPPPPARERIGMREDLLLLAGFASGLAMLALEVVWFRFLLLFVAGTSLAFALMLAVVLAGIGAGGLLAARLLHADPARSRHAPAAALATGALVAAAYAGFRLFLGGFRDVYAHTPGDVLLLCAVLAFPAAAGSGVLFTFLGAALQARVGDEARATGLLTLANTAGATLGSAAAGFVLLPRIGIEAAIAFLSLVYGGVALAAIPAGQGGPRASRVPLAAAGAAFAAAMALFPFGSMERVYLRIPASRFEREDDLRLEATREGLTDTLLYLRRDAFGAPLFHRLVTNGFSMSATNAYSSRYMKLFVWLPLSLRPDMRDALQISFGVGMTAQALAATKTLSRIDVVDLSPEILEMRRIIFPDPATDPLRDPRVTVHVEDGRFFLQTTPRRYDLVTGEPPPPRIAGVVNLYSRDYFQLVRERLTDRGLASYWLPVDNLAEHETRAIVRAFCDVFSDCTLWGAGRSDWILLGSRGGDTAAPPSEDFARPFRDPAVRVEMARLGTEHPEQLGALFLADADELRRIAGTEPPLTDDFPRRIGNAVPPPGARPLYESLRDPARARARFAASAWVKSRWPAALREASLPYFDVRAIFDRQAAGVYRARADLLLGDLDAVLARPALTTAVWWMFCEPGEVALAERAEARGERSTRLEWVLGARDLGARDFAAAAHRFRASRTGPENPFPRLLEAYALARAEDAAGASAAIAPLPAADPAVRFLVEKLGVAAPTAPTPRPTRTETR